MLFDLFLIKILKYIRSTKMKSKETGWFRSQWKLACFVFVILNRLAKKNDPNFYTRFSEVYPYFQDKLLSINLNLQTSELILLAYIYLNFETKEIADYIFKSSKTIQNRKHLLRKKLNIPTHQDFHIWLKSNFK